MIPSKGVTPHPGEMLLEEFLKPMGITQAAFARYIDIDVATMSSIINGKRDVTPTMALKFGQALGVSPETWVNLQSMHTFTKNREALRSKRQLPKIKPMPEVKELVEA